MCSFLKAGSDFKQKISIYSGSKGIPCRLTRLYFPMERNAFRTMWWVGASWSTHRKIAYILALVFQIITVFYRWWIWWFSSSISILSKWIKVILIVDTNLQSDYIGNVYAKIYAIFRCVYASAKHTHR